ncbi:amino acid ABC transporter permease [Clostridium sp. SYSU_GA19001]|uniref:amino acid ABC transporter permease n=1 Tax=Clostridium caldaquaticum TaxID=2940653 RepID=UPI002076E8C3|nr:amino acid ABC transporter permease [Clostridium caldaquaticum]MCM8709491.1 amino acid ABC transporter permease [Clostridium caldaquaticum]
MDFSFLFKYYMFFLNGAKFTLILAFFTVLFGVILGLLLALMRISKIKVLNIISGAYIEFIRGTPLMVQIFIIYYALPDLIGFNIPEMPSAIMALAINSGAYVAEIIRAGIQAVDKGQMEAARSLGLSYGAAMRYVIVPQAIKNILPALGNEFVVVIKESSVVSVIGIKELMYNADTVRGNTFRAFEPLIVAALIYFIMTFTLSKLMGRFERRLKNSD